MPATAGKATSQSGNKREFTAKLKPEAKSDLAALDSWIQSQSCEVFINSTLFQRKKSLLVLGSSGPLLTE